MCVCVKHIEQTSLQLLRLGLSGWLGERGGAVRGLCGEGQSSEVNVTTNMQTLTHTKLPLFVRVLVCVCALSCGVI